MEGQPAAWQARESAILDATEGAGGRETNYIWLFDDSKLTKLLTDLVP